MSTLSLLTPPAKEPVSLADMKTHLRVDITDDDALIASMITAARVYLERLTGKRFVTQQWRYLLDHFPGHSFPFEDELLHIGDYWPMVYFQTLPGPVVILWTQDDRRTLKLPIAPVQSIDRFTYTDTQNNTYPVPADSYVADCVGIPARLKLKRGFEWPACELLELNAVSITFTVGYPLDSNGNPTTPADLVAAVRLLTAHLYENREASTMDNLKHLPLGVGHLVANHRMWQGAI